MIKSIKSTLKRNPKLYERLRDYYANLQWRRAVIRDLYDNKVGEKLKRGVTPYGFKMVVRNHPANQQMLTGDFEKEETKIIQDELDNCEVFVDVGANIGIYTCMAIQRKKYAIAIEPQFKNLACLYETLNMNDWKDGFEIYPIGLDEYAGLKTLYGASGPSASLIAEWAQYGHQFKQQIPVIQLDTIIGKRLLGKRVFIKIDVEGYEYYVMRGAEETLKTIPSPSWLIEICLDEFHPSGINPNYLATFELFWRNGYEARTADARNELIHPNDVKNWTSKGKCDSGTFNYIFRSVKGANK